jgi:hypothetical protein
MHGLGGSISARNRHPRGACLELRFPPGATVASQRTLVNGSRAHGRKRAP